MQRCHTGCETKTHFVDAKRRGQHASGIFVARTMRPIVMMDRHVIQYCRYAMGGEVSFETIYRVICHASGMPFAMTMKSKKLIVRTEVRAMKITAMIVVTRRPIALTA